MKKSVVLLILLLITAAGSAAGFFVYSGRLEQGDGRQAEVTEIVLVEPDREVVLDITDGATYGKLMEEVGVGATLAQAIFDTASELYDLSSIRVGRQIKLTYDKDTDELKQFYYQIDSEEELYVRNLNYYDSQDVIHPDATVQRHPSQEGEQEVKFQEQNAIEPSSTSVADTVDRQEGDDSEEWQVVRQDIPYEVRQKISFGKIETSMYQSALDQGIDERAIVEFGNVLQWTIDFAYQVQAGDIYKFIYEERYLNGEYVMPGRILAGKFTNVGTDYYVFYYEESEDNQTYFDVDGNSVQKMFLKAPVAFKYISSGFTTGLRYVEAFNVSTGHRAIDYAAEYGTPIRAVGDGTVVYAGWNGAYGNFVSVRHNSTYSTNYAHMSKIAVKYGEHVMQGETIGYVGSTGFSTGPHVHFEMVKNGVKINPLTEVLPPGEPIKEENRERFIEEMTKYREQLN